MTEFQGVVPALNEALSERGYTELTPVQTAVIAEELKDSDLLVSAQTGSGKTLGFMLPALVHINAQPPLRPGDGPMVLVLAPTRELAMQIQEDAEKFGESSRVRSCAVFGGVPRYQQPFASYPLVSCQIVSWVIAGRQQLV